MSDEPPDGHERQGLARGGHEADDAAHVQKRLEHEHDGDAARHDALVRRQRAALAMRMPANRMQQNSAMTTSAPSMPNSSPMMEKMKSVSASGR